MTELQPNMFLEITRGLITIAGWWVLFYKLHRPPTRVRRIALLVSLPALYFFWRFYVFEGISIFGIYPPTFYAVFWSLIILFFALLVGDWRSSLFTAIFYIGVEQIIDVTRMCAYGSITGGWPQSVSLERYVMFNLQYLFVLGWTVFYYWILKKRKIRIAIRNALMTLAPPIAMFLLLTHFDEIALPLLEQGDNIYSIGFMVGLIFFVSHHLSFYFYVRQLKMFDLQMQSQTLQSQLESQIRQNQLIEGAQKQAAEIRHEMKNLIFALQIELKQQNYEGIETRLNALAGELKHYELKPYTAVPVIDAMLSYKGEMLREHGAVFTVTADPLDIGNALAYDLTSLLAIALDNAIDAIAFGAMKDAPVRGALVSLKIGRWKNMVFIQVTNPLTKSLKYRNGELQSTKDDPGHGLGLLALRRIVERYSGEVKISDKDGMFSLEVMLVSLKGLESPDCSGNFGT
ncbi:MAG: GHKL domain-containing protein [Treponema sp.]|jgi:hypothetical protein|nr:GHKL domain-containing protein [Treponema sp.]